MLNPAAARLQRRQPPAEHMILPGNSRDLRRPQVETSRRRTATAHRGGVGADRAGIMRVDIAADGTGDEPFGHRLQRREQRCEAALALLHQMQHRPPRRPRAGPREPGGCWTRASISVETMARVWLSAQVVQGDDWNCRVAPDQVGPPRNDRSNSSLRGAKRRTISRDAERTTASGLHDDQSERWCYTA